MCIDVRGKAYGELSKIVDWEARVLRKVVGLSVGALLDLTHEQVVHGSIE